MTGRADDAVLEFAAIMRRLRADCSWKAAQTHRSLARYLLEETHETIEALDTGDTALLREELGDLLLQVFLHTAIAEESGDFTLGDVAADATAKMVSRNPHVFGPHVFGPHTVADGASELTPEEVNEEWERRKAVEKSERSSVLDGIPATLPALLFADKVIDRITRQGGDLQADAASEDLGERLLALVAEARADGVDAEQALRDAVRRRVQAAGGRESPRAAAAGPDSE